MKLFVPEALLFGVLKIIALIFLLLTLWTKIKNCSWVNLHRKGLDIKRSKDEEVNKFLKNLSVSIPMVWGYKSLFLCGSQSHEYDFLASKRQP